MKILTFGEILFDEIEGKMCLGGAPLNLAGHLSLLKNESYIISGLGDDTPGKEALKAIKNLKINTDFIQINKNHPTGLVKVKIDDQGMPTYNIIEDTAYDNIEINTENLKKISNINFDCFCFGTLAQRNKVSRNTLNTLLDNIKAKHIFCDLNLRQEYFSKELITNSMEKATILKINDEEAYFLSDLFYKQKYSLEKLFNLFKKDFSLDVIVITCGKDGCVASDNNKKINIPGIETKVVDTVGAGDAFSAAFLSEYLSHQDIKKASEIANQRGAKIAGQTGAI